jgi:hypothetical protein
MAQENLIAGMPEAAMPVAQQAYRSCSRLRLQLEFKQNEWQMAYLAACEMVDRLYGIIEENWNVYAVDIDGNEIDCVIDVNFWTDGMLSQITLFLDKIREWLATQREGISLEQLLNLRAEQLLKIENAIHDCRFQARLAVLSSQLRINIADVALTALEEQGFAIQKSGYDRHDKRASFTATTRHLDGSEVVIKVVPSGDDQMKNDLHVQSSDAEVRTQHELRLRMQTIQRILTGYGLELAPIQVEQVPVAPDAGHNRSRKRVTERKSTYR